MSPLLFAIFIDNIVKSVRSTSAGCYISCVCCSIFLYADDILLISPNVSGLQILVDACERELINIDMKVNVKKSSCIRFGPRFDVKCADIISVFGGPIGWVESCRYLGVFFVSARIFQCSFHDAKSRFFRGFNAIFGKVGRLASEEVVIALLKAKCLPILLYATEAVPLLSRHRHSIEFTITRICMKLFSTGSSDVVNECLFRFNFLPINLQLFIRTARFLQRFLAIENSLCYVFADIARTQLSLIFSRFGSDIKTACQLSNAIYIKYAHDH